MRNPKVVLVLLGLAVCPTPAQDSGNQISPAAKAYLEQALDLMQENALHQKEIDWKKVREESLSRAASAQTTEDTYPAIAYALSQLKESHSFLQLPDNMPAKEKTEMYGQMRKVLGRHAPERKPSPFSPSKDIIGHIDHFKDKSFAHVVVPLCGAKYAEWEKNAPDFQQFADKLHATVVELAAQNPAGWIVDLRGNGGGNMWPMLAGIGAVLGEADLGAFISPDGKRIPWHYKEGQAGTLGSISARITQPPFVLPGTPPVAVLFDRSTASSGEAVAISFAGRPRERSFGEHTAGYSTSNGRYPLPDGAALFLCNGIEADRTGKVYPDGVDPDVAIEEPETRPAEDQDAGLRAAEAWLMQQHQ